MLRPSVEELVRVKDVDVQMREFLANLRVSVEAGQKGKKKKAKKKPKKKKEKKGKKKKDPTEGRSMERCAARARARKHSFLKPFQYIRRACCRWHPQAHPHQPPRRLPRLLQERGSLRRRAPGRRRKTAD
jgi:hypothetical protein